MKYIIMADGKGKRWNYYNDIPKHLIEIDGETLIARTVRLLRKFDPDSDIIITSHDKRYEVEGAVRYEPKSNFLEIDRFTAELIEDNECFLYGDTYYTEEAIDIIVNTPSEDLLFFGNEKSIVAIKITDATIFKEHIDKVRKLYVLGKIKDCKGWQVYQSFMNLPFDKKQISGKYIVIKDLTCDFNIPEDLINFEKMRKKLTERVG